LAEAPPTKASQKPKAQASQGFQPRNLANPA
jgi:hypothetical protein